MDNYLIELGGTHKGYFTRNNYISYEEATNGGIERFLQKLNNTDAYSTVYLYETDDIDNCLLYAPIYLDLDIDLKDDGDFRRVVRDTLITITCIEEELNVPSEYIRIFFSGSKGFHIMIDPIVFGIDPDKDLNDKYKKVATRLNRQTMYKSIDTGIYDRKRLFRLPNSINSKTGLYKVPIDIETLRRADYEFIKDYASSPKELEVSEVTFVPEAKRAYERLLLVERMKESRKRTPRSIIPFERKELLPCVEKLIEEGVGKGGRNNACVAIASSVVQSGVDREETVDILLNWNENNDPPLPESEVVRTVYSAYSLAQSGRGYGCNFFKEHDYCIGSECSLYKNF